MNDSVYAFDADSATGKNAKPLWHTTFLVNGATAVPISIQKCGGTTAWTQVGVVSTPVIDPVAGTIYVVAKTMRIRSLCIAFMR
jgi:large repetitive protein